MNQSPSSIFGHVQTIALAIQGFEMLTVVPDSRSLSVAPVGIFAVGGVGIEKFLHLRSFS